MIYNAFTLSFYTSLFYFVFISTFLVIRLFCGANLIYCEQIKSLVELMYGLDLLGKQLYGIKMDLNSWSIIC